MVKEFNTELRRQELYQKDKIQAKAEELRKMRRRDLVKDTKRSCVKRNIEYKSPKLNVFEYLTMNSQEKLGKDHDQKQREVHSYRVALSNTEQVLRQLEEMKIKNERPADYLVEMYKSDRQMFKVRRHLTQKEEDIKQKMQGKDWQSKTKKRERAKAKAEVKKERKKTKISVKKNSNAKPKMKKVNGKNKVKSVKK